MSILSRVLSGLTGPESSADVTHPCQNCESSCRVCPDACAECKPYKEKLLNVLYNVEHLEEFNARYEVVSAAVSSATVTCPFCGGTTTVPVCEYCGSKIGEDDGKIRVSSAAEIPNPVIEARDLIYARRKIVEKYSGASESSGTGLLGSLVSALTGDGSSADGTMTESEIEAMAGRYGVSVHDYLEGLDMGTYLSRSAYEEQQSARSYPSAGVTTGMGLGAAGLGAAAGMLLGNNQTSRQPNRPPMPPQGQGSRQGHGPQPSGRPPMGGPDRQRSGGAGGSRPGTMGGSRSGSGSQGGGGRSGGPMGGGGPRGGGRGH